MSIILEYNKKIEGLHVKKGSKMYMKLHATYNVQGLETGWKIKFRNSKCKMIALIVTKTS